MEHYNEMLAAAREFGFDIDHLDYGSKWQRAKTVNKPKCQNGSYYIFPDEKAMILWDWQRNISKTWRPQGYSFTRRDKIELNLVREAEKAKRIKNREKAIRRCISIWRQSSSANNHSYIIRKGINPYCARIDQHSNLVVPILDSDGELVNLQFIDADGNKRYKAGAKLKGCALMLGSLSNQTTLLVCEGYATGCSLHEASGVPVVVAFNAGNLLDVCTSIKRNHPMLKIIICADNDHQTESETGHNTGIEKATLVARKFNSHIVWPNFDNKSCGTDFNDVHCQLGLGGLRIMLSPVFAGGNK